MLLSRDAGAHVLLLVDGHALNEAWGAAAYYDRGTGVPMELVDHIELIIGPGSVLYGSNAMLGVVNIVTRRGKDSSGAHVVLESELAINWRGALGYGRNFRVFGRDGELTLEVEHFAQKGTAVDYPTYEAEPDAVTGLCVGARRSSPRAPTEGAATIPRPSAARRGTCACAGTGWRLACAVCCTGALTRPIAAL